jgi:hypothetical protein
MGGIFRVERLRLREPGREQADRILSVGVFMQVDACSNGEMGFINPRLMCSGSLVVTEETESSSLSSSGIRLM